MNGYQINIIQGWVDVAKNEEIPVLLTTYEDYYDDPQTFIERILKFYEISFSSFQQPNLPKTLYYNFRKGSKDEWKEVLTPEQIEKINSQIPEEFFELFHWER